MAGIEANLIWLVVASAVASAIGAFYYLRIVYFMYFGEDQADALDTPNTPVLWGFLMASSLAMLIGVINTIRDDIGSKAVMYYQVDLELIDMANNLKVWIGDKKIKKLIKKPKVKW